jgi:hypothetical protein
MSTKYETRPVKWIHGPAGEPTFSEMQKSISIEDEAGGEYIKVEGNHDDPTHAVGSVLIDPDEWPSLKAAIDNAVKQCRNYDHKPKAKE